MMQAMSRILEQSASGRPLPSSFGLKQVFGLIRPQERVDRRRNLDPGR